jgi:hypothetical protein
MSSAARRQLTVGTGSRWRRFRRDVNGEHVHHELGSRMGGLEHIERPQVTDVGVHRLALITGQRGVAPVHDVLDLRAEHR